MACFLGNDFLSRPLQQGHSNVFNVLMPKWTAAGNDLVLQNFILDDIGKTSRKNKSDNSTWLTYRADVWTAYNTFTYAPYFITNNEMEIVLTSLNPLDADLTFLECIGWDPLLE